MSEPSREKQLEAILHGYLQGVDAGQNPDREELLRRYPDFAEELREYFAAQAKVDRMALALNQAHVGDITLGTDEASTRAGGLPRIRYFGDYELLEEIARGGMGVVYKARQVSLKRLVALKMILAGEYAGHQELARFRTEAQAVASLQHQHIVQIYEVGEHEGHPYFSLEFCAGGSLAHKLGGTPLTAQQAAQMVETLARTMHVAHQAGVVHRDLKPANVLLTVDGTLKITDFGLAKKLEGEPGASAPAATASGAIMGTPSYMAPEQAAGKGKEAGPNLHKMDVYALGAILYEMLTGRPPFRAATPLETLLQVVADEPVSPSQLQRKTPKDLVTICLKCLQKEPGKRYATALALAEDLRRFQAGEPILARPTRLPEKAVKWARRHPVVAATLATVFLIMFGSTLAVSWWFSQMVLTPTAADAPEIEEWSYPAAARRFHSTSGNMEKDQANRKGTHRAIWITADDYSKVVSFYAAKLEFELRYVDPDHFPDAQGSNRGFSKSRSGMFSKRFESRVDIDLLSDRMGKPSPGRERPFDAAFRVGEKDPHPLRTHCLSRRTDSYLVTVTITRAEDGQHTYIVLVYDVR